MHPCELYLLTPSHLDPKQFKPLLEQALDAGPIAAVQLRINDVSDQEIIAAIEILSPIVQDKNIAFILNNRPDLAKKYGCDGAHINMNDNISVEQARSILGDDLQLGVSCYNNKDMAMIAGEKGADYITFGNFFPSTSQNTDVIAPIELLSWWTELMELPVVAIGGITAENCKPLIKAGADFLSVTNAIWEHPKGPAEGVLSMLTAIRTAQNN